MRRFTLPAAITAALCLVTVAIPASAAQQTGVSVSGAVSTPASYTAAQLAGLPQVSYPVTHSGGGTPRTVTGVSLEALVDKSTPVLPAGKNTQLRVLLTVSGDGQRDVFALGELTAEFGNHPAVLTTHGHHVALIVPGDTNRLRGITDVHAITVTVSSAAAATPPPGSVLIETAHRIYTLSARRIAALPARTVSVTFLAGGVPQTHTETGPSLALLLLSAGILPTPDTSVVAVGDDGYGAAVTLAENYVGGKQLLLSTREDGTALAEPRLVVDGDGAGGRYVSGVVVLQVR
ncbi:MAG TPA: hypothetical protein VHZ97_27115 [Pseudonocardiaceae bacterium]|jgi:hypothetical protein|nr:hypothetical protein [Pseudonocardiaceae bacterium]